MISIETPSNKELESEKTEIKVSARGPVTELNKKTKSTLRKNKRMRNNDFGLKTSGSRTNVFFFSLNRNAVVCSLFCIW